MEPWVSLGRESQSDVAAVDNGTGLVGYVGEVCWLWGVVGGELSSLPQ